MKGGQRKAFFTGGNSSCRAHIRSHYPLYQQRCKEQNIPENHYAIPREIWRQMKAEKLKLKGKQQVKLDGMLEKKQQEFTREGVIEVVTKFVACDDQVWP